MTTNATVQPPPSLAMQTAYSLDDALELHDAGAAPRVPTSNQHSGAGPKAAAAGVIVLAVLAVLYTIYFARSFLLPIAVALLLSFLLSPLIRALGRIHIPAPAAAALLVLSFASAVGLSGHSLVGPVEQWVTRAPNTMRKAEVRIRALARPVDLVAQAANEVERAAVANSPGRAAEVVLKSPSLADRFLGTSQAVFEGGIEVVVLLFFLLAGGDLFLEKLVKVLPRLGDKRKAFSIARTIESSISTYLLTIAAINIGEGAVVTVAMWALGMPTPFVWGAMVACLEFIPYIGAAVCIGILAAAGLTTFTSLTHALAAPILFFAINLIQGNLVSPLVMSKRLTLNPVALFVGFAFWWWAWGIAGALVAVPLLATFKIFCDHITALAPVGEFLGGREQLAPHGGLGVRHLRATLRFPESSTAHV